MCIANRCYGFPISGAGCEPHPTCEKWPNLGPSLAAIRVWPAASPKWRAVAAISVRH